MALLPKNTVVDALRFARHSSMGGSPRTLGQYEAQLTKAYHRLEKGLALPEVRLLFGRAAIEEIVGLIEANHGRFGQVDVEYIAVDSLQAYIEHHRNQGCTEAQLASLQAKINGIMARIGPGTVSERRGGVQRHSKDEVFDLETQNAFLRFLESRHSVRSFSSVPVPVAAVERAVSVARKTPSVCNRQPWKAYVTQDADRIESLLSHQNGNRGFDHVIGTLLVVAADLESFLSVGERHQAWIDGGMFAMSLVYALHAQGLGTCCLNWSVTRSQDRALRDDLRIRPSEEVVMMIAVGNLPDSYNSCRSTRKPLGMLLVSLD